MNLLVEYKDLETIGFDAGGTEMLSYKGKPFTGFIVEYYTNGILMSEEEYKDGYKNGVNRSYFENGQIEEEYFSRYNCFYSTFTSWNMNGNLILKTTYDDSGNEVNRIVE